MNFQSVACIGAGFVGQSWATLFSLKGLQVYLQDVDKYALKKALERVESNLYFLSNKKIIKKREIKEALDRIIKTTKIEDSVRKADYVQESVPDIYELKNKVFKKMDSSAPECAILASSSSGLLMTEIQKSVSKPDRCVLTHPMLPPHIIPIVEIVGGKKTSKETIMKTRDFMIKLGKVPIVLNREVPGYIVNRLQAAIWREAVSLVTNGVASAEDIDRAFCLGIGLRDPIFGPFMRAHIAGGEIERFLRNFSQSYSFRWESMEAWTSMPDFATKKVIESVREIKAIQEKTFDEIQKIRDEKLIEIISIMLPKHPFY